MPQVVRYQGVARLDVLREDELEHRGGVLPGRESPSRPVGALVARIRARCGWAPVNWVVTPPRVVPAWFSPVISYGVSPPGSGRCSMLLARACPAVHLLVQLGPRAGHSEVAVWAAVVERAVLADERSGASLRGLEYAGASAVGGQDDRDPGTPIIRTAHGVGYACAAPVDREPIRSMLVSRWLVVGARRFVLVAGENVIGRDPAATILLDVSGVSRRHAQIVVGERDAILEDLGSKNGTRIGDNSVRERVTLRDGDQIHMGPALVIFHASTSGSSTDTVPGSVPVESRPTQRD